MKGSAGDYLRTTIGYITYPVANAFCRFGGREPQPMLREKFSSDIARMMYGALRKLKIPNPDTTARLRAIEEFVRKRDLESNIYCILS